MSERDPAFLWESAAMRASRERRGQADIADPSGWATLRQAHRASGVPVGTLRKWGRNGAVPSTVVDTASGLRRLVKLDAVIERATAQGRRLPDADDVRQNAETLPPPDDTARKPAAGVAGDDEPQPAEGTMIVPIAAWEKMLMQLGNLHEAGQQLAEARERAAKAETEATFLRERLSELRPSAPAQDAEPAATPEAVTSDSTEPAQPEPLWEYALRRWRSRRR